MKVQIKKQLIELGFSPIYLGFEYWTILVELILTNNRISLEQIYKHITGIYGCKRNSVESALRYSMANANHKAIADYCGGANDVTIKTLARWIEFNMKGEI